jgi:hypothetical protein
MPAGCATPATSTPCALAQTAPRVPLGPSPASVNDPTSVERNHEKMRRALFLLIALSVVAGLTGCIQDRMCCRPCGQGTTCALPGSCACCPETCQACPSSPCATFAGCGARGACGLYDPYGRCHDPEAMGMFNPGPPTGAVTYPYYTVHGPRDFLAQDMPPIGP